MGRWSFEDLWEVPLSLGFTELREAEGDLLHNTNEYLGANLPANTSVDAEYSVPIGGSDYSTQEDSSMATDNSLNYSFEDSLTNAYNSGNTTPNYEDPNYSYLGTDYDYSDPNSPFYDSTQLEGATIQGSGWMSSDKNYNYLYANSPTKAEDDSLWGKLFNKQTAPIWAAGISAVFNGLSASEQAKIMAGEAEAIKKLSDMQLKLFNEGQPLRELVYGQLQGILSGKLDPSTLPAYANYRNPLEQQFAQARKGIESNVRGEGALTRALTSLESTRATEVGSIPGKMYSDAFAQSLGVANPALGVQQLQSAGATRQPIMNMATNLYQQSSQQLGQSGQTLGMMLYDQYLTGNS